MYKNPLKENMGKTNNENRNFRLVSSLNKFSHVYERAIKEKNSFRQGHSSSFLLSTYRKKYNSQNIRSSVNEAVQIDEPKTF